MALAEVALAGSALAGSALAEPKAGPEAKLTPVPSDLDPDEHRLLVQFSAMLAAAPSATSALQQWCARHRLADPAVITATRLYDAAPLPADIRRRLGATAGMALGYRHVALRCGGVTLSFAHNWYVAARLTPVMNAALADSDVPFGAVAAPLGFTRSALAMPPGGAGRCPAGTILATNALLHLPDHRPLALVVECYTRALVAITRPGFQAGDAEVR